MTEQDYLAEQAWFTKQSRHFDYLAFACCSNFHRDDNMALIEQGFDIVCHIARKPDGELLMLAGEMIMATSIKGAALAFARDYMSNNEGSNLAVLHCDNQAYAVQWLCN
mgnify:CR=1 FL=1